MACVRQEIRPENWNGAVSPHNVWIMRKVAVYYWITKMNQLWIEGHYLLSDALASPNKQTAIYNVSFITLLINMLCKIFFIQAFIYAVSSSLASQRQKCFLNPYKTQLLKSFSLPSDVIMSKSEALSNSFLTLHCQCFHPQSPIYKLLTQLPLCLLESGLLSLVWPLWAHLHGLNPC